RQDHEHLGVGREQPRVPRRGQRAIEQRGEEAGARARHRPADRGEHRARGEHRDELDRVDRGHLVAAEDVERERVDPEDARRLVVDATVGVQRLSLVDERGDPAVHGLVAIQEPVREAWDVQDGDQERGAGGPGPGPGGVRAAESDGGRGHYVHEYMRPRFDARPVLATAFAGAVAIGLVKDLLRTETAGVDFHTYLAAAIVGLHD